MKIQYVDKHQFIIYQLPLEPVNTEHEMYSKITSEISNGKKLLNILTNINGRAVHSSI